MICLFCFYSNTLKEFCGCLCDDGKWLSLWATLWYINVSLRNNHISVYVQTGRQYGVTVIHNTVGTNNVIVHICLFLSLAAPLQKNCWVPKFLWHLHFFAAQVYRVESQRGVFIFTTNAKLHTNTSSSCYSVLVKQHDEEWHREALLLLSWRY